MRFQWIPLLVTLVGFLFLGSLIIQRIGAGTAQNALPEIGTIGPLVMREFPELGLSFYVPENWKVAMRDANSLVMSQTGSKDTVNTAGPFLYIVVDALTVFKEQINLRTDLNDPVEQLEVLIKALNRDSARFKGVQKWDATSKYPGAYVRGYERGNALELVLLRADDGRWIYAGMQAPDRPFLLYREGIFRPALDSLTLKAR